MVTGSFIRFLPRATILDIVIPGPALGSGVFTLLLPVSLSRVSSEGRGTVVGLRQAKRHPTACPSRESQAWTKASSHPITWAPTPLSGHTGAPGFFCSLLAEDFLFPAKWFPLK